jgi:ATP-dependent helicase/nuclease subunit A
VDIRMADRNTSLYEAMKKLGLDSSTEISEKVNTFLNNLQNWRNRAKYMSTDELIWYLYTDTGFYGFTGAMPGGQQRQSNLRILFERARQFEETSYKGLFNFINFVNRLKSSKGDMGSAKILSENENVVRIMSIHKSKGLEFPIVFLSGCGKRFNLQDMNRNMLLHQDLGFGPDFVDFKRRFSYPSIPKQALRNKIKIESLSEEMRILYVAFTRAKEKLIITGSVNNLDKVISKFVSLSESKEAKLPSYDMLKGKKYFDWILPALLRHKDCSGLRDLGGVEQTGQGIMEEDQSSWEIKTWTKSDILGGKVEAKHDEKEFMKWLEQFDSSFAYSEYSEEISRRLDWEYQYKKASEIPVKISVTELKRRFAAELSDELTPLQAVSPILIKKPAFMEESKGLSAAEIGTILHFIMQHLDFRRVKTIEDITFQVGEMVFNELLTEQQAKTVKVSKIFDFFHSSLGTRMLESERVYREMPFNIEVASTEFYKELETHYTDETLLLQGVIDCFFEEGGKLVLLDYKTDYVPKDNANELKEKYRLQIEYYTKALEQLTGKRVKDRYIYSFWNGEVLDM